jgi:hypothetical protein
MASKDIKLQKFSGKDTDIPIEKWLKVFDLITIPIKDDVDKNIKLISYLEGKAFEYYADHIATDVAKLSYVEVKKLLVDRFCFDLVAPSLLAIERKLKASESVRTYYDEKLALLDRTQMTVKDKIALLTKGLPEEYQKVMISACVEDTNKWLVIASNFEANFGIHKRNQTNSHFHSNSNFKNRNFQKNYYKPNVSQVNNQKSSETNNCTINHCSDKSDWRSPNIKPFASKSSNDTYNDRFKNFRKNSIPKCRICSERGLTEYHFYKECPNLQSSNDKVSDDSQLNKHESNNSVSLITKDRRKSIEKFIKIYVSIGKRQVRACIDTCSSIHMMDLSCVSEFNLFMNPNDKVRIAMAQGTAVTVGTVQLKLTIGNYIRTIKVHILRDFDYTLLLGSDIFDEFPIDIIKKVAKLRTITKEMSTQTISDSNSVNTLNILSQQPIVSLNTSIQNIPLTNAKIIENMLNKYSEVFSDGKSIGLCDFEYFRINLTNDRPISQNPRRTSAANEAEIQKQVAELLQLKFIRKSVSPYAAPITLANKRDGTKRMCIDYSRLNQITVSDKQPIPHIQTCIETFANAKIFSQLDVKWCYHHFPIHPDDIQKTAFVTSDELYEWTRLPFGLKNAPAYCVRQLRQILKGIKNVTCYFDDIAMHGSDWESHNATLQLVLERLKKYNIKLNKNKCNFGVKQIEFLGHIVIDGNVKPQAAKLEAVKGFPKPNTIKDVMRFNGLASYLRKYIPNFVETIEPITRLFKKKVVFSWGPEQRKSFDIIKTALTTEPCLKIFDQNCKSKLELHTDASAVGIGVMLIQDKHPIGYFSRKLTDAESKYTTTELECLAVRDANYYFNVYLENTAFTLVTDHMSLKWLLNFKQNNRRLYRWAQDLSQYDFDIIHRPGERMAHVDALSRAPVNPICNSKTMFACMFTTSGKPIEYCMSTSNSCPISSDTIIKWQTDSDFQITGRMLFKDRVVCIRVRNFDKIVIPKEYVIDVIKEFHDKYNHPGSNRTLLQIKTYFWWSTLESDTRSCVRTCHQCQLVKPSTHPSYGPLMPIPTPKQPNDLFAMDTIVVGNASHRTQAKNIQLVIDHNSRWVGARATKKNTTAAVIDTLESFFRSVGPPKRLLTDNHPNFTSRDFEKFLKRNNIEHLLTTTYHPMANGLNEKANGTISQGIRLAMLDKPTFKWSTCLPSVVNDYNRTIHTSTGFTPEQLMFGINLPGNHTVDSARSLAVERSDILKAKVKAVYDKKHPSLTLSIGDLVKKKIPSGRPDKEKFSPRFEGPFKVIKQTSPVTFHIQLTFEVGPIIKAHINQLEPYYLRVSS